MSFIKHCFSVNLIFPLQPNHHQQLLWIYLKHMYLRTHTLQQVLIFYERKTIFTDPSCRFREKRKHRLTLTHSNSEK